MRPPKRNRGVARGVILPGGSPVAGQNKYLFLGQVGLGSIGSSSQGDIQIIDVSNLAAPVEVGFIHITGLVP